MSQHGFRNVCFHKKQIKTKTHPSFLFLNMSYEIPACKK